MFWLIDSCQNSVSADQYRLALSRAQVSTHWVRVFFLTYPLTGCYFSIIAGSSSIFLKSIWNESSSWAALLKYWFRTDLGRENSTGFYVYMRGICGEGSHFWLVSLSRVGHALRTIFMFWLVKIWQVSSRGKFMQRLETCLLIAGAYRVLCHLVMF